MALSLPDARHLTEEVVAALRVRVLPGCALGFTETDVAQILGVSRESVSRWWSGFGAGGLDALPHDRTGRPIGSGRTLWEAEAHRIEHMLDGYQPEDCGIAAPLWTQGAVAELIRKECGLTLPVRTVGEYLKRWGYTAKKPRHQARKQEPEEVRQWFEGNYPAIEHRAEAENADIHRYNETGVAADEHPARGYAREGQAATLDVPDKHMRMNQIATITNAAKVSFMTYGGSMNTVFLIRLLRSITRKIFLIVDWLRAHEGPEVEKWLAARRDHIELSYLPRYGPERNATEYLNHDLMANVHVTGLPNYKQELRSRMQVYMRRLLHLPRHVKNYFRHPYVLYAMGS
jgi:transposase